MKYFITMFQVSNNVLLKSCRCFDKIISSVFTSIGKLCKKKSILFACIENFKMHYVDKTSMNKRNTAAIRKMLFQSQCA